jgi:hypothetical protein
MWFRTCDCNGYVAGKLNIRACHLVRVVYFDRDLIVHVRQSEKLVSFVMRVKAKKSWIQLLGGGATLSKHHNSRKLSIHTLQVKVFPKENEIANS